MKTRRILALILALLLAFALTACQTTTTDPSPSDSASTEPSPSPSESVEPSEEPSPSDTSITVTDMTGREVTLDAPATKIVALTPSDCEILFAIGSGDTVVGRGEYCDYPEAALELPSVSSGSDTNIEQIIALGPDVVIMSTMAQTPEHVESLENAGITVFVTESGAIDDVYDSITLIGQLVGNNDGAADVISSMQQTFADIEAGATGDGTTKVYFEVYPLAYGPYAAGSGTFMDEIANMLGLTNIFNDVADWPVVSEEQIIERNPDYIITTMMAYDGEDPVEEIMGRAGWESITAVANDQVFMADSNALTRPGPRLAEGAQALYELFYGE